MLAESLTKLSILRLETFKPKHIFHRKEQLFCRDRLFQKVECTQPGSAYCHFNVCLAGHHHDWCRNSLRFQILQKRKPVLSRHDHIGKHEIERLRFCKIQRFGCTVTYCDLMAREAESTGQ